MARTRLVPNRVKVGEHNGIDVFFNTYEKKFTAAWKVGGHRDRLKTGSFLGMVKKLDRIGAEVLKQRPQTVIVETSRGGADHYSVGKTTGRVKFDDQGWRRTGTLEVKVGKETSWHSAEEVCLGSATLADKLNRACRDFDQAEKRYEKLKKGLKHVKLVRPKAKPKKEVTSVTTFQGGSASAAVSQ